MKILIVQLSDIHFKISENSVIEKENKLFEAIRNSSLEYDKIFLVVTGDTAYSGKKDEFEIGAKFIKNLQKKLIDYSEKEVCIIVIAGNHDCDFALDNKARQNQLNMIQNLGDSAFDSSVIEQCTSVQEEYFNFMNNIQTSQPIYEDGLVSIYNFQLDDKKVIFHCYNTAYSSEIHEQGGKMFFPTSILPEELLNEKGDIIFSLLHHPFHWLNPVNRRELSTHIHKTSDFYLTGHEHETTREKIDNLDNNIVYHLEGSVLQESDNNFKSEFNLLGFDLEKESFKIETYFWNKEKYNLSENNVEWTKYKRNKNNFKTKYSLNDEFKESLNDVGGKFKHPNVSDINLSDIYVFPILRYFNTKDSTDNGISLLVENSESVIQSIKQNSKYVFFGGENIGKSSLLRMIFFELHKKGYVPLLLDGRLIKSANFNDFKDIVKSVFISQYGEDYLEDFYQEDISNIFILIDDFDKNPLKNQKAKGKFIKSLSNNYKNLIFVGNELYAIEEIFTDEANSADLFSEFIQYEILEFNHSLRYKLINKWYALGNEDYSTDEEICRKIDDAVRAINVAMGQRIVPNYPIFLLILLQALETTNPHDLQISSYGNYYQLLILKTLTENIKDQTELNIYKSYCGELANFFFNKKSTILSIAEFSSFHDDIKSYEKLDLPKSMTSIEVIDTLCKAGILNSYGDNIEFKYQYTYYFFEAQHLAKYINKDEVKILISKLCQRLYRTEFANILLFLIHFSSDEFIIDELLKNAKDVFDELNPCKLEDDISLINSLVTELPRLYLKSKSHEEIREEENNVQDSKSIGQRENKIAVQEYDIDEDISEIDIVSKLNLSFKLIEILGQIIKNNPSGSMTGPVKHQVLKETYELGLRTLNVFFTSFIQNTDFIVNQLTEIISKIEEKNNESRTEDNKVDVHKDKISKVAKHLLFSLCTQISYTFIKKISDSVGNPKLMEKYGKVQEEMDFSSVKLVNLLIKLDHGSGFPDRDLQSIKVYVEKHPMAYFLLKRIIVNHLHRHPVNYKDKQRICEFLGISVESQIKLDLERNKKNTKKQE